MTAVMSVDAVGTRPAVVIAGYGFTADELAAAAPPRLRPTVGTEPFAGWARIGDLVLAYDRARGRTEIAQLAGKVVERDSATVHWYDRRWSHCRLSDIVALLEPVPAHRWAGPTCVMCSGSGTARWTPADGIDRYVRCPACNGHGRDPS